MARTKKSEISKATGLPIIKAGTAEKEALLSMGYNGMTREKANTIIKERAEKPDVWPYSMLEKAKAFLAALDNEPIVVSPRPGWKRSRAYGGR